MRGAGSSRRTPPRSSIRTARRRSRLTRGRRSMHGARAARAGAAGWAVPMSTTIARRSRNGRGGMRAASPPTARSTRHSSPTGCAHASAHLPALRGASVVLAGFAELTPQQERLRSALAAAGVDIVRLDTLPEPSAAACRVRRASHRDDEIARALAWARARALAEPAATIAIAVADLASRREEIRARADDLLCPSSAMAWPRDGGASVQPVDRRSARRRASGRGSARSSRVGRRCAAARSRGGGPALTLRRHARYVASARATGRRLAGTRPPRDHAAGGPGRLARPRPRSRRAMGAGSRARRASRSRLTP